MNRRRFLELLGLGGAAAVALATVDPEALLWTPGAKTFFLPSLVEAENQLVTVERITREALKILHQNLTFAKMINRRYDDTWNVEGATIGSTLNVRVPLRFK